MVRILQAGAWGMRGGLRDETKPLAQSSTLRTTPLSRLSGKRVSRSWYAAPAKFARNCNRHGHV